MLILIWYFHLVCNLVRIVLLFCGEETIENIDLNSIPSGTFQNHRTGCVFTIHYMGKELKELSHLEYKRVRWWSFGLKLGQEVKGVCCFPSIISAFAWGKRKETIRALFDLWLFSVFICVNWEPYNDLVIIV